MLRHFYQISLLLAVALICSACGASDADSMTTGVSDERGNYNPGSAQSPSDNSAAQGGSSGESFQADASA